ncbi:TatD family deoxyribonuclease [Candidatus Woesearchaeota archaeon]|nr:MAG: TatD family deoxyribonuclease [Candidatus Woesearchaeota archaeon]
MHIVDVHCHIDLYESFAEEPFNLDAFIDENKKAGVKAIISNGTAPESNRKVLELAKKHDVIKPALGFYPTHVLEYSEEQFDEELKFIAKQDIIAIGEIGLDKYHIKDKLPEMSIALEKLIHLAKKMNKPCLIHSRNAEMETIDLLENFGYKKIVMHCFSGRKNLIKRIIDNGWHFSIPCTIVKLEHFQNIVKTAPFETILTETDGPFLSPFKDSVRNEPRFIAESIQKIAEIKQFDPEETANMLFMNYQRLFL